MKNFIIYLIGFPGVGKLTIAKELAKRLNAHIIDNHLINNPIFQLIVTDPDSEIPEKAWDKVKEIREIVLSGVEELAHPDLNFIFTNSLLASNPDDLKIYERVERAAKKRKSTLVPIRLVCELDELCKRVVSKDREVKLKLTNAGALKERFKKEEVYHPASPLTETIDVTNLSPQEVVEMIMERLKTLKVKK